MPLLTPHWDAPKKTRKQKQDRIVSDYTYRKKNKRQVPYDPTKMTLLERSSLERSKLALLHRNRDIIIGKAWGPRIARQIAKCIGAMNPDVDVIIVPHRHPLPFHPEYNQEYSDVFVRWHRTVFDGQRIPEIGEVQMVDPEYQKRVDEVMKLVKEGMPLKEATTLVYGPGAQKIISSNIEGKPN